MCFQIRTEVASDDGCAWKKNRDTSLMRWTVTIAALWAKGRVASASRETGPLVAPGLTKLCQSRCAAANAWSLTMRASRRQLSTTLRRCLSTGRWSRTRRCSSEGRTSISPRKSTEMAKGSRTKKSVSATRPTATASESGQSQSEVQQVVQSGHSTPAQPIATAAAAIPSASTPSSIIPSNSLARLVPTPHKRPSSADPNQPLSLPRSFKSSFKASLVSTNSADVEARVSEYVAIRSSSRSSTPALDQAAALIVEEHLVRRERPSDEPDPAILSPTPHNLVGASITSDIYQWAHHQRTANASSPTPTTSSSSTVRPQTHRRMGSLPDLQSLHIRNSPDIVTASQLREPGAFRRRFITERNERAGRPVTTFLTRNFIDFLALYGFYGGDVVPEEQDDEDEDDDLDTDAVRPFARLIRNDDNEDDEDGRLEGLMFNQRVGRPGGSERQENARDLESDSGARNVAVTEATPLMSNSFHGSIGGGRESTRPSPNVKGTSAKKAFFMLMKSFVGTGVLFLPKAFAQGGLAFSIILLVLFGWMTLHCMLLLLETSRALGGSFGDIGEKLYGPPVRYLVLGSIAVSQAGFACAYYIFVAQNLRDLLMLVSDCTIILPDWLFIVFQILIYVPLAWVRKIKFFSLTSLIADVFILAGLLYIFYQDVFVLATTGPAHDIIWFNLESFPIFIGTALFAFEGICLILPIAESMKNPEQFPTVLTFCITFIGSIFVVIGVSGYLAFGDSVETIIFLNMPKDSSLVQSLQFFYAMAIMLSFPLCVYPSIRITESALFGLRDGKSSMLVKWQKNLMRTLFVAFLASVAWTGSNHLDKFVSLVGCLACIPLSFIYPAIFHYHVTQNPWVKTKDIGLVLFGLVALVYTTYITVTQWVAGSPDIPVDRCQARRN